MYTVYTILAIVLVVSFITGSIVLYREHKLEKKEKPIVKSRIIVDEDIIWLGNFFITLLIV